MVLIVVVLHLVFKVDCLCKADRYNMNEFEYQSQTPPSQDRFVSQALKFKRNGFFVDIGAHHYKQLSNTYFLEKELNWEGLAVEFCEIFKDEWVSLRPKSNFVVGDATILDYTELLAKMNAPKVIDYLSVDIEPPMGTLAALLKILETPYEYRIITFEIDSYRGDLRPRDISRKVLSERGYSRIESLDNYQDDFWVNYNFLDSKIDAKYLSNNFISLEHIV